ncbi:MAG TPA: alpha/beta fold hydrolase [Steroidobacteraceae bacterium]|jgi:pimeloyl-ACP methyl ester carboxylesterase
MRSLRVRVLILTIALALASGCATRIGVEKESAAEGNSFRTQSALTNGRPSQTSTQFLFRLDLVELAKQDPQAALMQLHAGLGHEDEPARLMALAELSFIYAAKSGDRAYDLAAAAYAWAFLFPSDRSKRPGRYDFRVALALGIYGQAITKGLTDGEGEAEVLDLSARAVDLPFGTLELLIAPDGFHDGASKLTDFVALDGFKVYGLRNRYRRPGIGAALVADASASGDVRIDRWLPPRGKVPVTLLLRFDAPRQGMAKGALRATIELHDAVAAPAIEIDDQEIPLESDYSAALAYRLEGSRLWDFAIAGFRGRDSRSFFQTKSPDVGEGKGLFMLRPYMAGRTPIVFVHGTASSPARWAEMVNEILGDPELARKYQCWFFIYNTGDPIPYSALRLREALEEVVKDVDPEQKNGELRKMVVIGHSQGGLLAKMLVVNSDDKLWNNISKAPFEQASLRPETRDLLRRALFVKPLPFVRRVVFIATPHRGSSLASNWLGRIANRLVRLPVNLLSIGADLLTLKGSDSIVKRLPTSVDNMKPSNPFLKTLAEIPVAPSVHVNSIIAIKGDGPPAAGDDGVVAYRSAHIEPAESELIVHSGHSTQGTPSTIEEVRRILQLSLEEP